MVIDTSAIIAILFEEPEAARLVAAIDDDAVRILGAPTLVEAGAVMILNRGESGPIALDALIQRLGIRIEVFSDTSADFARSGYARYGKGVGSPSVLNYGDCLSYGLAQAMGQPLLFKGKDFSATDVAIAEY